MSFQTKLLLVLARAYHVHIEEYMVEDDGGLVPTVPGNVRMEVPDGEGTQYEFADQAIEVNEEGSFVANDITGKQLTLSATMIKGITQDDLH